MENRATCGFCQKQGTENDLVRGRRAWICHACLTLGITSIIESSGKQSQVVVPGADTACSFCGGKTPPAALHRARDGDVAICATCTGQAYSFVASVSTLTQRRYDWSFLEERSAADILRQHFETIGLENIVTSARKFPEYMRVDLNKTLLAMLDRAGVRCSGLHQQYAHETLTYASVIGKDRVHITPLQYDEVDIGSAEPVGCLRTALWLIRDEGPRHAILLSRVQSYGQSPGWHVEIAVPPGVDGSALVRSYFDRLEDALERSASYRGKVLSLESEPEATGMAAAVKVHRLSPVAREDVILPEKTLELLERNVFRFMEHRPTLRSLGLPAKKGLLFYGPPGTGKTHTIRYLAGALKEHTTLLVTGDQVGHIAEYMILARLLSPSIVVIEDADLIAREREQMGSPGEEVLLNRLLNEMDGLKENAEILFILTTNRPESLEAALTARPGRIDQAIEFPFPDADGRRKLARLYGRGAAISDTTFEHVVERTERVSAAFIKELMRRSVQFAIEQGPDAEIGPSEVDAALDELLFAGGRLNAALLGAAAASRLS